MTQVVAEF